MKNGKNQQQKTVKKRVKMGQKVGGAGRGRGGRDRGEGGGQSHFFQKIL